jgi:hypothetical protein
MALADDAALARMAIAARRNAVQVYRLELSDRAVEGMPARPRTVSGRLICLGHRSSTAATTPCPSPVAVATAPSLIAAARSSCSPPPRTAAPRG